MGRPVDTIANPLLAHITGTATMAPLTTFFLGLFHGSPTDAGLLDLEVDSPSYARQQITFIAPADRLTQNAANVTFPEALEPWGLVSHWAVMSSLTGGQIYFYGEIVDELGNPTPRAIQPGDIVRWLQSDFTVRIE